MNRSAKILAIYEDERSTRGLLTYLQGRLTSDLQFTRMEDLERWVHNEVIRLAPTQLDRLNITQVEDDEYPDIAVALWRQYQNLTMTSSLSDSVINDVANDLMDHLPYRTGNVDHIYQQLRRLSTIPGQRYHTRHDLGDLTDADWRAIARQVEVIQTREEGLPSLSTIIPEMVRNIVDNRNASRILQNYFRQNFDGHLRSHERQQMINVVNSLHNIVQGR